MSERRPVPVRAAAGCLCVLALLLLPARAWSQSDEALPEPLTQRLIVKFRAQPAAGVEPESEHDRARVSRLAVDRRVPLAYVRPMALGAHVVELDHPVPLSEAREIAQRLAGNAEVEYIQPDRRMRAELVPDDQYLNL